MAGPVEERLKNLIAQRKVVFLIGAGVSVQVTGEDPASSWPGFMERGVETAAARTKNRADVARWQRFALDEIDSRDTARRLAAEDIVLDRLGGMRSDGTAQWLKDSVGSLKAVNPEPIHALAALGAPLMTLNYDGLLESVTQRQSVTWKQSALMRSVILGVRGGDHPLARALERPRLCRSRKRGSRLDLRREGDCFSR